jgi:hypothetical protein
MPRNGSGTYSLPVGNPVVTGTTISSTWANNTLTDISNALTGSLSADGQTTASGNLNMGTYKIINAGDPTNPQDVATKYYVDQLIAALGTMAYQNATLVAITGGAISNVDLNLSSKTNEVYLPKGSTALRTASPVTGILRYNTTESYYEGYTGGVWVRFQTFPQGAYTFTYLIIAGGGAGGYVNSFGGGGGGGGFINSSLSVNAGTTYTMVIGGGGTGIGGAGTNSSITSVAIASGGGAGGQAGSYVSGGNGYAGASGGGGGSADGASPGAGGAGVSGQGNTGGNGATFSGGGGGGGGATGGNAAGNAGGVGGIGHLNTITGSAAYYGGGGGGGGSTAGVGGSGGGGNYLSNGSINTGGGAGAGVTNGGSGVIILSVPTVNYSGTTTGGPTITISGANTILKFTSSGTYTA